MSAEDTRFSMSQEHRVYSKFRPPDLADIANMRPGVSRDRILEAWMVTRLSSRQALYRPDNSRLYFCDSASGETSDIVAKTLSSLKSPRPLEPVRIDALGALFVGTKVLVKREEFSVVSTALRLSGITVDSLDHL
ncbi:MAG: hypothetical protein QGH58_01845 [Arenicellales bacterium]|mgnify:CR=1 FL=1|jgi:hypothetical protein|nr:hypothetical protein [Arenicellales bacterium]MDP6790630.1 hypothetical protein [Arenicellales bacterium]MDP6919192.1 hypothetical protein [Arenicellales bacterium]|tara:strand:+ start:3067 stop:3471 length:405 start_codon:yes stop_codon:yes gene_type:complete